MFLIRYDDSNYLVNSLILYMDSAKYYFYYYNELDNNPFLDKELKDKFKRFIERNSKLRCICRKFMMKCKDSILRSHESINNIDLLLNNIDDIDSSDKIELYENGRKYIFSSGDIKNIFVNSLSESSDGWPLPKVPKNPYTNLEFTNEQLRKLLTIITDKPLIIVLFEEYGFDIEAMKTYHLSYFKKLAINDEYSELDDDEKRWSITTLVNKFTNYNINQENIDKIQIQFTQVIKDFNLMNSCDSKYLKNYLYNGIKRDVIDICHKNKSLIVIPNNRKILRAKRIKD